MYVKGSQTLLHCKQPIASCTECDSPIPPRALKSLEHFSLGLGKLTINEYITIQRKDQINKLKSHDM